jgi:hypothetical protein
MSVADDVDNQSVVEDFIDDPVLIARLGRSTS